MKPILPIGREKSHQSSNETNNVVLFISSSCAAYPKALQADSCRRSGNHQSLTSIQHGFGTTPYLDSLRQLMQDDPPRTTAQPEHKPSEQL